MVRIRFGQKANFNLKETGAILGVSRPTLYRWLDQGRFPHAWKTTASGGGYRIPKEDIESVKKMYPRQKKVSQP